MERTYEPESTGTCPHCLKGVQFIEVEDVGGSEWYLEVPQERLTLTAAKCPLCERLILAAVHETLGRHPVLGSMISRGTQRFLAWPRSIERPIPEDVPEPMAADYREAALVLDLSPKASAALSRRCLQSVLRQAGGAQQRNLSDQIDAVMKNLPSYIAENIDAIRKIGNFAAHPSKDSNSGAIVDVEPGEAEWNLDVLDSLFDFYYVQPTLAKARRDKLNEKLKSMGEPPMKQ